MHLTAVIETHREALKRIVAGLVAMVGGRFTFSPCGPAPTLPRRLHRTVLRLLRPAESAARRLVIVLARNQPPLRDRAGAAREARAASILPRAGKHRRPVAPAPVHAAGQLAGKAALRPLSFPLLDPLRLRFGRSRRTSAAGVPRICIPGVTALLAVPARMPARPEDPVDAGRLHRRLAALAGALDDLPVQAKRFARWQARRDRALGSGRIHRVTPLRGGRPPGGRLSRYQPDARRRRNVREVDEILAHAHALARFALNPDTS